jgi:acyl carrier protein
MGSRENEVRALVREMTGGELREVGADEDLVEVLGLDSLASLRVLAAVEKRFEVRFPDERLAEYRTIRRILEVVDGGGA